MRYLAEGPAADEDPDALGRRVTAEVGLPERGGG
jgi:hypothetical protein